MSDVSQELTSALHEFVGKRQTVAVIPATVLAVDTDGLTCDVEDSEGIKIFDVRLRSALNGDKHGFVIIPKADSSVLIANIGASPNEYFVVSVSEVSKVTAWVDQTRFDLDATGILLQRSEQTLKLILNALIDQIKLITVNVTAVGSPTGPPINAAAFDVIKNNIAQLLR